jgi:hypothetical protein
MKYLLLIHDDPTLAAEDRAPGGKMDMEYAAFTQEINDSNEIRGGDRLHGVETATTVRVRSGKAAFTDGPFVETREHLGGYYIVDVANLDRALELAAKIPSARTGAVEVRPIHEMAVPA